MHAHTFTHRCSLFSQAAINLHAWGYESIGGRKRERLKVREGLFKVNRGEQVSFFWSDLLNWQSTPLSHAWVGKVKGHDGGKEVCVCVCVVGWIWVSPMAHKNVNWLAVVSNRLTKGSLCFTVDHDLEIFVSHYRTLTKCSTDKLWCYFFSLNKTIITPDINMWYYLDNDIWSMVSAFTPGVVLLNLMVVLIYLRSNQQP